LVHFGKIADIYFSLTVDLRQTNKLSAKHEFFSRIHHRQLFFSQQKTVNTSNTRATRGGNARSMNAKNLIGRAPTPQAKFVKFFTISARLM